VPSINFATSEVAFPDLHAGPDPLKEKRQVKKTAFELVSEQADKANERARVAEGEVAKLQGQLATARRTIAALKAKGGPR
jgi:hypothetical protein